MEGDVITGRLEKFRHLRLCQPYGVILQADFQLDGGVRLIQDYLILSRLHQFELHSKSFYPTLRGQFNFDTALMYGRNVKLRCGLCVSGRA